MFKIVCAWCLVTIKEPTEEKYEVSHGICPTCYAIQMPALESLGPPHKTDHSVDMGGEG